MSRKYFVRFLTVSTSTATPSKGLSYKTKQTIWKGCGKKKKKVPRSMLM